MPFVDVHGFNPQPFNPQRAKQPATLVPTPWEHEEQIRARAGEDGLFVANGEDPRTLSNRSDQGMSNRSARGLLLGFLGLNPRRDAYTLLPSGIDTSSGQRGAEACAEICAFQALDPDQSSYVFYWDMVMALCIVLICFWTPYEVVFVNAHREERPAWTCFLDAALTTIFIKDIFMSMITGYTEEKDGTVVLVLVPWRIVCNYVTGRFWLDVIAGFPFETVAIMMGLHHHKQYVLQALNGLRLLRLVRLARFARVMERWQHSSGLSYGAMSLMKFAAFSLIGCHWMSCIWGFLALHPLGTQKDNTWLTAFAVRNGIADVSDISDPHHVYVMGLYWALMTLTSLGYGDITAVNVTEFHVCIVFFVISGVSWAYIIGSICRILGNMDPLSAQFQSNMDLLNIMMEDYDLEPEMRRRLRDYFAATRSIQRKMNQQSIIESLSPGLQGELSVLLTHRWISRIWYFADTDSSSVTEISQRLVPAVFSACEKLVLRSSTSMSSAALFVVVKGVAGDGGKVHIKNSVIGDDMIISNPLLRQASTAVAITVVEVMYLKSEYLDEIRNLIPALEIRIRHGEVRWSARRGFVLAAWRQVRDGLRSSEYFEKNVPSFSSREVLEHWCSMGPWLASSHDVANAANSRRTDASDQEIHRRRVSKQMARSDSRESWDTRSPGRDRRAGQASEARPGQLDRLAGQFASEARPGQLDRLAGQFASEARPGHFERLAGQFASEGRPVALISQSSDIESRKGSRERPFPRFMGFGQCQLQAQLQELYPRVHNFRDEMLSAISPEEAQMQAAQAQNSRTLIIILKTLQRMEERLEKLEKRVRTKDSRAPNDMLGRR